MKISKYILLCAGVLSFLVAIFQAVITLSPAWSEYFGAPKEITSSLGLLYFSGFTAAIIFIVFGLYALSGAGRIRPLPFLRWGLLGIGSVYLIRGLVSFPILLDLMGYPIFSEPIPPAGLPSSLASFFIGILYLLGTVSTWKQIRLANRG